MHNLISRAQLQEWNHVETSIEGFDETEKINDYYECLIECDSLNQNQCKRICKEILMQIRSLGSCRSPFFVLKYIQ